MIVAQRNCSLSKFAKKKFAKQYILQFQFQFF